MSDEITSNLDVAPNVAPTAEDVKKASRNTVGSKTRLNASAAKPTSTKSRRFRPEERIVALENIDAQLAQGTTLKEAVLSVGISDQTYYIWKRASSVRETPAPDSAAELDDFAEFVALEKENSMLRAELAKKLRAENAELRRRLEL